MAGFNGKAFLLGIQHLDMASRELFDQHGKELNGRWALAESLIDEAMVRLVGAESNLDPDSVDRLL